MGQIRLIQEIVPTWRQAITVCGDANQSIYGIFALAQTFWAEVLIEIQ